MSKRREKFVYENGVSCFFPEVTLIIILRSVLEI